MLRSKLLYVVSQRRCISYLSNNFNDVVNQAPPLLPTAGKENEQHTARETSLDIFIKQENRQMDLLDVLLRLRKQKESSFVPLFPLIMVRQIIDSTSPQDLVAVLRNPLQYGVFIDQFSGCFILDQLLHTGNALEAAQIASLLIDRNLCNNELLSALVLQSFYTFLKDFSPAEQKPEATDASSSDVEKVRVKFLRNYYEQDPSDKTEEKVMGRALIKLAEGDAGENELKKNFVLLGFALCGQISELEKFLNRNQPIIFKDILKLCQTILNKMQTEPVNFLQQAIEGCTRNEPSIEEILESNMKRSVQGHEAVIIGNHLKLYEEWVKSYRAAVKEQVEAKEVSRRVESIQNILNDLEVKRQNLWFFENKDDIDIQIYKKKVFYPKRWFGKKKKPKVVDTFYVPPNITRSS